MLNLAPKCRVEFRLPVDIQLEWYSLDFLNQKKYAKRVPAKVMYQFCAKQVKSL